jgi:hypothetical protein
MCFIDAQQIGGAVVFRRDTLLDALLGGLRGGLVGGCVI